MKISIIGRQMTVGSDLKELVAKKLSKFDKFFDDNAEATVTFSLKRNLEIIEIMINSNGIMYRSEESGETFRNALDRAVEILERQIRKNKTKLEKRLRAGAFNGEPDGAGDIYEDSVTVIRTKTFPFKPMPPEDAILQMNLLGHHFFAFANSEMGERICVVYLRADGGYGMLVPEI